MRHLKTIKFQVMAVLLCLFITTLILAQEPQFRFGVVADIQYADRAADGDRYFRQSLVKLQECVNDFNDSDLAFTMEVGDIVDMYADSYPPVFAIYNQLNMPHYGIIGNHEFLVSLIGGYFSRSFVLSELGLEKDYYSFVSNGWRFIALNSTDLSIYSTLDDPAKQSVAQSILDDMIEKNLINGIGANGAIGRVQKAWLIDNLRKAECLGQKVIVFGHLPFYPANNLYNQWNDTEMVSILGSYDCVVAYINGHDHRGGYAAKDGVHYLTLKGMVETQATNAYAIVEVYDDRLEVIGFGREPGRTLNYPLTSLSGPAAANKK